MHQIWKIDKYLKYIKQSTFETKKRYTSDTRISFSTEIPLKKRDGYLEILPGRFPGIYSSLFFYWLEERIKTKM
jgi:hypothetical protein